MKKNIHISVLLLISVTLSLNSCSVQYSLTGASIDYNEIKTLSVQYFPNRAEIIVPTLSQQFTDALRDKFRAQTKLKQVTGLGDVNFEGEITRYTTQAMAIQSNEKPAKNRLTIEVKVRYTNNVKPESSFESNFARYQEYDSNASLSSVESSLIEAIIEQITEDIFNKAFVNW
jgi:hypothetical protein